jgi:cytochrome c oxidase subunit 1
MADAAIHGHEHEDQRGFFTRWFMSTNHKDIGILYLITSAFVGFVSVAFTVYMRLELMDPGVSIYVPRRRADVCRCLYPLVLQNGHLWNVLITGHGILMMFFVVIPALFGGFGNYFHAFANWRTGYGVSAHEQPVLLALCGGYDAGDLLRFWRQAAMIS